MPTQATIRQGFGESADNQTQLSSVNVGTVATATGLSVVEQGDAVNHKTVLTLTDFAVGSAVGAANLGFGALLYTLPAGAQIVEAVYMSVALTGTATIVADTPDVGVGSTVGTGAIALLTTTMIDYVDGQTSGAISGANTTTVLTTATAGALTGIALNVAASAKTLYLNCADGWAGAGDVTATGTIHIIWKMAS
jgi:hypothetical protein